MLCSANQHGTATPLSAARSQPGLPWLQTLWGAASSAASPSSSAICNMACSSQPTSKLTVSTMDGTMQLSSASLQPQADGQNSPWLRIPSGWAACRIKNNSAVDPMPDLSGSQCEHTHGTAALPVYSKSFWSTAVLESSWDEHSEAADCLSAAAQLRPAAAHGPLCHVQGLDLRPVIPVRTYGPSPTTALQTPRTPRWALFWLGSHFRVCRFLAKILQLAVSTYAVCNPV